MGNARRKKGQGGTGFASLCKMSSCNSADNADKGQRSKGNANEEGGENDTSVTRPPTVSPHEQHPGQNQMAPANSTQSDSRTVADELKALRRTPLSPYTIQPCLTSVKNSSCSSPKITQPLRQPQHLLKTRTSFLKVTLIVSQDSTRLINSIHTSKACRVSVWSSGSTHKATHFEEEIHPSSKRFKMDPRE